MRKKQNFNPFGIGQNGTLLKGLVGLIIATQIGLPLLTKFETKYLGNPSLNVEEGKPSILYLDLPVTRTEHFSYKLGTNLALRSQRNVVSDLNGSYLFREDGVSVDLSQPREIPRVSVITSFDGKQSVELTGSIYNQNGEVLGFVRMDINYWAKYVNCPTIAKSIISDLGDLGVLNEGSDYFKKL